MFASSVVFATAVSPGLFGWLLDRGVSFEAIAAAGAVFVLLASVLPAVALRRPLADLRRNG